MGGKGGVLGDRPILGLLTETLDQAKQLGADSHTEAMCMAALVPVINMFGYDEVAKALKKLKSGYKPK